MDYRVEVSDPADEDLDRIIDYIKDKLKAPIAAANFIDEVFACYGHLEQNPYMYEACRDPRLKAEGYHRAVIKNYVLLYKIYEDKNLVIAHRFFYGGQDYVNLI